MQIKAVILTISDSCWRNEREDKSGPALEAELKNSKITVLAKEILPDELERIKEKLIAYCLRDDVNLILTTGGTGISARDVTPEATRSVIQKEIPGLAELMRLESLKSTPHAALTRAVAGTRNRTLIVNLPGSVRGAKECFQAIAKIIPHAIELLAGHTSHNQN